MTLSKRKLAEQADHLIWQVGVPAGEDLRPAYALVAQLLESRAAAAIDPELDFLRWTARCAAATIGESDDPRAWLHWLRQFARLVHFLLSRDELPAKTARAGFEGGARRFMLDLLCG